jgi:hypothetical protein
MELHADSSEKAFRSSAHNGPARGKRKRHERTKPQLLTRAVIDGRSGAAKLFDRLLGDIEADLGGRSNISTVEHALAEAFAGAVVAWHNLNTRLLLGENVDFTQHAAAASTMVRIGSRLGLSRRSRLVTTSTLNEILNQSAAPALAATYTEIDEMVDEQSTSGTTVTTAAMAVDSAGADDGRYSQRRRRRAQ